MTRDALQASSWKMSLIEMTPMERERNLNNCSDLGLAVPILPVVYICSVVSLLVYPNLWNFISHLFQLGPKSANSSYSTNSCKRRMTQRLTTLKGYGCGKAFGFGWLLQLLHLKTWLRSAYELRLTNKPTSSDQGVVSEAPTRLNVSHPNNYQMKTFSKSM